MTWLKDFKNKKLTKERVLEISKKYTSRSEFRKKSNRAYEKANKNGWLDEMTWLKPKYKPSGYWTKEHVFEESKKYTSRSEFSKYKRNVYDIANKNGWLDEMTWFKK